MPVEQELVVKISGDGRGLTKSFSELEAQLKRFQEAFAGATDPTSIARLNKAIEATQARMKGLQTYTGAVGKSMGAVSGSSDKATQALGNLSRIAQDAPFGFIGIMNNINPMLESFQRLQKETGSTGGALKAMVAGLTGAGGLGLAVGIVSSLLVVFGDKLFTSKTEANKLVDELKRVGDSAADAGTGIQGLINDLSFLNQYQKLSIEISGGNTQQGLRREIENNKDAVQTILDTRKRLQSQLTQLQQDQFNYAVDSDERKAAEAAIKQFSDEIQKTIDDEASITRKSAILSQEIRLQDYNDLKAANKKKSDEQKRANDEALAQLEKYIAAQKEAAKRLKAAIDEAALNPDFTIQPPTPTPFDGSVNFIATGRELNERANPDNLGFLPSKEELDAALKRMEEFRVKMAGLAQTISGQVAPAFQNMFGAILAGEPALISFFKSIGDAVVNLINQLIAAAVQAAILSLLTGGASGGGVSFLGAFKNILKGGNGLPHFAEGGIISGPTLGLMGEYSGARNNPEVVAPLSRLTELMGSAGGGQVVIINSRIRGKDLQLQASRSGKTKRRVA